MKAKVVIIGVALIVIGALVLTACGQFSITIETPTPAGVAAVPTATPGLRPTDRPTHTPTPTGAPTGTRMPTNTPSSTPTPIDMPTSTPTPVPPTATPAPTLEASMVNLQEVRELLWSQSSFRWTVIVSDASVGPIDRFEAIRVREPESYYVPVSAEGAVAAHWIKIGSREWFGIGTRPDVWLAKESLAPDDAASELVDSAWEITLGSLRVALPDQQATLVRPAVDVGGILCSEYAWSDGEDTGHVFIAWRSYLPVKSEVGSVVVDISHVNDPSNVIQAPLTDFPEKLHIDDAWMAVHGLTSFQWSYSMQGEDSDGKFSWIVDGTYVQSSQAWLASIWLNQEEASGPPILVLLQIGEHQWQRPGTSSNVWVPSSLFAKEKEKEYIQTFQPFVIWDSMGHIEQGSLILKSVRTIEGVLCNEYRFAGEWKNDQGQQITQEVHLFAAAGSRLPMRVESSIQGAGGAWIQTWQLSHLDDPFNVVEPPGE